jgi:hypothetical protein
VKCFRLYRNDAVGLYDSTVKTECDSKICRGCLGWSINLSRASPALALSGHVRVSFGMFTLFRARWTSTFIYVGANVANFAKFLHQYVNTFRNH